MKKHIFLFIVLIIFSLMLASCGIEQEIKFDLDNEISKITNQKIYPEDLLEKKEEIKNSEENIQLINVDLIGYESANNKLPLEEMFLYNSTDYNGRSIDWFGEKWDTTPYITNYTLETSAVKIMLGFDINNIEYANRKIRELSDSFLRTYNNIIYTNNIYEYDVLNTENASIDIIAEIPDTYIHFTISVFTNHQSIKIPYIQIYFIDKDSLHDIDDADLKEEINSLKNKLSSIDKKPMLRTIRLTPNIGYIIDEPKKDEDKTQEEILISSGVFYIE